MDMGKELSEMTLEELWELFPIFLIEPDEKWVGYYDRMSTEKSRISFNKGYTKDGFADKVYHAHLRYMGDNDELYFRDYLNEHPQIAKKYEILKLGLWKKYEHNRDAYTDAKTGFICKWTAEARKLYGDRY